jgi:hypothetical protein
VSPAGEQARLQYLTAGSLADRPRFPRVTA